MLYDYKKDNFCNRFKLICSGYYFDRSEFGFDLLVSLFYLLNKKNNYVKKPFFFQDAHTVHCHIDPIIFNIIFYYEDKL